MKSAINIVLITVLTVLLFQSALSQDKTGNVPVTGLRKDFLDQLKDVEGKIIRLAEAMPQESYAWRPMEGVRSVSEVFMHIATSNYLLMSFAGVTVPEEMKREDDKTVTEKSKVIAALKKSFAFTREAVTGIPDANLDHPAKFFGSESTVHGVIFNEALHLHEHLGQSIAYARMNKVVPPWTAAEQAEEQKKKEKK